ncbi:MAG: DUF4115 domain-containing protein [Rhizonema sp. PD38]|nr:DUF4115 domain-containing protein [Rhizonema sp. PD38]
MKLQTQKKDREPIQTTEQQQSEKLAQLGVQLWTSRLEQGLSLEEMVRLTKIPRRLLQAIEEGDLDQLPEPIYVQGLIRQFADALGFDGSEFSSTFPIGLPYVSLKPAWKRPIGQLRPVHLYLLYIFLIICSVNGLSQLLSTTATWQVNNSNSKQLQANKIQSNQQLPVTTSAKTEIKGNEGRLAVQIGVTLKEKSWIRVVADGKITYEGELPEGTHRIWKAQDQLTVRAGNAGGVLVSVNKDQAKQMGEPGAVKELTIAANTKS